MMRPFGRADDITADSGAEGEEMQKGKNWTTGASRTHVCCELPLEETDVLWRAVSTQQITAEA